MWIGSGGICSVGRVGILAGECVREWSRWRGTLPSCGVRGGRGATLGFYRRR